jgi:protein YIPF6
LKQVYVAFDPMSKTNTLSKDNDEDFDEDNIPGFSHPTLAAQSPLPGKGKGRAPPEQLAPPSGAGGRPQSPNVSGNIGSTNANGNVGAGTRRTIGGVQVETRYESIYFWIEDSLTGCRYTGVDTLDEPVTTTIVSVIMLALMVYN